MNKEPSRPKPGSRRESAAHPVLARLPDVYSDPPQQQRPPKSAGESFVDYRFDMPAGAEPASQSSQAEDSTRGYRHAQPHAFHRPPRSDHRPHSFASRSRALPDSNPFAIPATSIADRLAPLVRFLAMFFVFTAMGTFMMSGRQNRDSGNPEPTGPSVSTPIPPKKTLEPVPRADHPSMATPAAFGPLGSNATEKKVDAPPLVDALPPLEVVDSPRFNKPQSPITPIDPPVSQPLAGANDRPLPRVQTSEREQVAVATTRETDPASSPAPSETDRAPAVARLPGVIFEAPGTR